MRDVTRGVKSAKEGGTEVTTKAPSKTAPSGQRIEVDFLYLDLATCSRCRDSDASLSAAIEAVRPALDSIGASLEVRKTLVVND